MCENIRKSEIMSAHIDVNVDSGAAVVIGAIAVIGAIPVIGGAAVVGAAVRGAAAVIDSAIDSTKILIKEKKYEKKLLNQFMNILNESQDEKQLQMTRNTMFEYLQKSELFDKNVMNSIFDSNKSIINQIQDGLECLELENKYKIISENLLSLNKNSELYDINIDDILLEYNMIQEEKNLSTISKKMVEINKKIFERNQQIKEVYEKTLKEKKFTPNFISFDDVEEKLLLGIFNKEISQMLEQNTDDTLALVSEKKTIDLLISVYEVCSIMANNPLFEDYSNKIISLWSSCILLTENDSISPRDYEYEIDLKIKSLNEIKKSMDGKMKEIYEANRRFNQLLIENNKFRKLLYLNPSKKVFNYDTYIEDSKFMMQETEMLIEEYKRFKLANYISMELKRRYIHENYKFIPTNNDVVTENHFIKKSYFITPDGQNVLCLNVNEKGHISEEVCGMKIFGLSDDARSIYEAQTTCCTHTKKILDSFFEQINYEGIVTAVEPDINNTIFTRNFTGIFPESVIHSVKNARLKRAQKEKRKRSINNG